MKTAYCLPIISTSQAGVLEAIADNDTDYAYFEVWLDYIDTVDDAFVKRLIDLLSGRLVILFRRQNLEDIKMSLEERLAILGLLKGSEVLVDLDITTQTAELDHIKESGLNLKTIASYHNYEQTPDAVQLKEIIDTMKGYQPSIYKLSALCTAPEDSLRLLDLLLELKKSGLSAIVSGMGEFGTATRVFGALWGNEMTFAPKARAEQSAPGQLTRETLETIFKALESD
jgi:3-dehydroquinate dehydratase type I